MTEVQVIGEDLNGLGWTLKSLIDQNIRNAGVWDAVGKIRGTLVVKETSADVMSTVIFDKGALSIRDGAVDKPSAFLAGSFDELSEVTAGEIGPVKALLTGKIKAGGNLWKLLKMAKAIIICD